MGIAPQTIHIPKWGTFLTTLVHSIARRRRPPRIRWPKVTLTWWQELQKRLAKTLRWWQQLKKKFPTAPLLLRQANRRRHVPQVNLNFAVRIPLRQLKQTRFCWPFSNWRRTPIQPISITTLAESRNCLNLFQRRCLHSAENQRNLNCLKMFSKQVWKFTISWRRKTKKQLPLSHAWWCSANFQKHH